MPGITYASYTWTGGSATTGVVGGAVSASESHPNVHPSLALNYIIKALHVEDDGGVSRAHWA